jgi:DNA repair ATPase RecN
VIGGFLDGATFGFSAGLNCLIGARGAGKTTVVELIRFALDILPNREAAPQERRRVETLIQRNLAGGRVKVMIETKDGLTYVVSRSLGEEPIVCSADGQATGITLKAGGLFRTDVYSQNEVESIADRATCQLSLLDNFQPDRIATLETQIHQLRLSLANNAGQIIPLRKRIAALTEELATLPGVEDRLKQFSIGTSDDAKVINKAHALKSLRDREKRAIATVHEALQNAAREFKGLLGLVKAQENHVRDRDALNGPNGDWMKSVATELVGCGGDVDSTGFGLPIAARNVATHGGTLAIQSREGIGTTVTLTIPMAGLNEETEVERKHQGARGRRRPADCRCR